MNSNNGIPYIEIPTRQRLGLRLLIDTGANKNYLCPRLVKKFLALPTPTIVSNISGTHTIDRCVDFNPFPDLSDKTFEFHIFDFHKFFHGLVGYETLQELKAKIETHDNSITILGMKLQMHKKYSEPFSKEISGESIINIEIPVSEKSGDFLLEEDFDISLICLFVPDSTELTNIKQSSSYRTIQREIKCLH